MQWLVVYIFFFGNIPAWFELTLSSMHRNPQVRFVLIGSTHTIENYSVPDNVRAERLTMNELNVMIHDLCNCTLRISISEQKTMNDVAPFLPVLFAEHLEDMKWWAWSDMNIMFGDLQGYMHTSLDTRPHFFKHHLAKLSDCNVRNLQHRERHSNIFVPLCPHSCAHTTRRECTTFNVLLGMLLYETAKDCNRMPTNRKGHFNL
jgi:hypothetical protein